MQLQARMPPRVEFDFEGEGERARGWLDDAYGTALHLTGRMGTVRHHRAEHGAVTFDQLKIDAPVAFDADAMPVLVVVDVLAGEVAYSRDGVTDLGRDGDTVLASGWGMPFAGGGSGYEVRNTSIGPEVLAAAAADIDPELAWERLNFSSYTPRSPGAGARWRATIDLLSASYPDAGSPLARGEASRLLGRTLLETFAADLVPTSSAAEARDRRDAGAGTVHRAVRTIEDGAHEDLSVADLARACGVTPRALQYAFRRELGCTPLAYLRRVRLDLARQALRSGEATSVAEVSADLGFFNPGRFAAEYRRMFGENPHRTLSRTIT